MAYKFNPFTGNLDNVGSSSGSSGVSQIIAGTGITISPVGGTGNVTINASGTGTTVVFGEIPTGTIDNSNVTFTLAHTPAGAKVAIYVNRSRLNLTSDYSISTATITLGNPVGTGGSIVCDYQF